MRKKLRKSLACILSAVLIAGTACVMPVFSSSDYIEPQEITEAREETAAVPDASVESSMQEEASAETAAPDAEGEQNTSELQNVSEEQSASELQNASDEPAADISSDTGDEIGESESSSSENHTENDPDAGTEAESGSESEPESAAADVQSEEQTFPEQHFAPGKTAGGVKVTAVAEEGAFPAGTIMRVSDVNGDYAAQKAQEAVGEQQVVVDAVGVDITFYEADGVTELQPRDKNKVHITMQLDHAVEGDAFSVVHVHEDAAAETVETVEEQDVIRVSEAAAEFTASEFSIYILSGSNQRTYITDTFRYINVGEQFTVYDTNTRASWSSSDPSVASVDQNGRITGLKQGVTTITARGGSRWNSWEESFTLFVGDVKVYVYVSARGISDEMLELLGIDAGTLDGNGFFPAGEISLNNSYLVNKPDASTIGAALINDSQDWNTVLTALQNMNTATLTGVYAANQGNHVAEYLSQAEADVGGYIGSGQTALFRWNMTQSYGFADQSVQFHLDLRFSTRKITFITGNNGITSGNAKDGTTVDARTYIRDSIIQQPRNLNIPDGYVLDGYYSDPDFTQRWDGIGTKLSEDKTVYIKLKAAPQVNEAGYITVQKTFSGLPKDKIPAGFQLTVAGQTLTLDSASEISADGLIYRWRIDGVSAGSYSVSETGEQADGYTVRSTIPADGSIVVSPAEIGVSLIQQSNNNNQKTWPVAIAGDASQFFVAAIKEKTIIITKNNLSIAQRMAIQNWIAASLNGFKPNYVFYNLEGKTSTTFSIDSEVGGTVNVTYANGNITFPQTRVWQHVASGSYSISKAAQNPDVAVANTYTQDTIDLTIEKKVTGNMGDTTKKFSFKVTDANGKETTFNLASDETTTINGLTVGSTITLYEASEDYTPTVQYGRKDSTGFASSRTITADTSGNYTITLQKDNTHVLVTNNKEATPDTGIGTDTAPYILLLMLAMICFIITRRRMGTGLSV